MSSPGELATLGEILRPQLLLYTRIAPVHTEFFPDLEGIVRAKAELLPWLDDEGTLVINANDPNQDGYPSETAARVIRYGGKDAEARIEDVEDRGLLGCRFRLVLPDGEAEVELKSAGTTPGRELACRGGRSLGIWCAGRAGGRNRARAPRAGAPRAGDSRW